MTSEVRPLGGGGVVDNVMMVFRRQDHHVVLFGKRSDSVGIEAGKVHAVPSGMLEAPTGDFEHEWDLEINVRRELFEEVFDVDGKLAIDEADVSDASIRKEEPIRELMDLLKGGEAHLTVTGVSVNLITLQTEINLLLLVQEPTFFDRHPTRLHWEYREASYEVLEAIRVGRRGYSRLEILERLLPTRTPTNTVPAGMATFVLGFEGLKAARTPEGERIHID